MSFLGVVGVTKRFRSPKNPYPENLKNPFPQILKEILHCLYQSIGLQINYLTVFTKGISCLCQYQVFQLHESNQYLFAYHLFQVLSEYFQQMKNRLKPKWFINYTLLPPFHHLRHSENCMAMKMSFKNGFKNELALQKLRSVRSRFASSIQSWSRNKLFAVLLLLNCT